MDIDIGLTKCVILRTDLTLVHTKVTIKKTIIIVGTQTDNHFIPRLCAAVSHFK